MIQICGATVTGLIDQNFARMDEIGIDMEICISDLFSLQAIQAWRDRDVPAIVERFKHSHIQPYVHGYFFSIDIGATDDWVRNYSLEVVLHDIDICHLLGAKEYIFHNNYLPDFMDLFFDYWFDRFDGCFTLIHKKAEQLGIKICIENVFDKNRIFTRKLMERYPQSHVGLCIDVGHVHVQCADSLIDWVREFGDRIFTFHIHDNDGTGDQHRNIGEGTLDFPSFFAEVQRLQLTPRYTLELFGDMERTEQGAERIRHFMIEQGK